jgi:hypothetical protein
MSPPEHCKRNCTARTDISATVRLFRVEGRSGRSGKLATLYAVFWVHLYYLLNAEHSRRYLSCCTQVEWGVVFNFMNAVGTPLFGRMKVASHFHCRTKHTRTARVKISLSIYRSKFSISVPGSVFRNPNPRFRCTSFRYTTFHSVLLLQCLVMSVHVYLTWDAYVPRLHPRLHSCLPSSDKNFLYFHSWMSRAWITFRLHTELCSCWRT